MCNGRTQSNYKIQEKIIQAGIVFKTLQLYEMNLPLNPKVIDTEKFLNNYFNFGKAKTCLIRVINHRHELKMVFQWKTQWTVWQFNQPITCYRQHFAIQWPLLVPKSWIRLWFQCPICALRLWLVTGEWRNGATSVTQLSSKQSRQLLQLLLSQKKAKISK